MILRKATKEEMLKWHLEHSKNFRRKLVKAKCNDCGRERIVRKDNYFALCPSCAHRGKTFSKATKALMSTKKKGKMHPNYGKHDRDAFGYKDGLWAADQKEYMQLYNKKYIKTANGKNAIAKRNAKRRGLKNILLLPLEEGEVGHHVTNTYVVGIPKDVHIKLGGRRKKHRTKVLQWLKANDKKKYKLVLCVLAKE